MKSLIELANQVCDRHLAPPEVEAPATAADILRRAAYRIGQPGAWCQGYAVIAGGRKYHASVARLGGNREPDQTCMMGALWWELALSYPRGNQQLAIDANSSIVRTIGTSRTADWNDAPERTQDQVVAALIKASEIAEEAE